MTMWEAILIVLGLCIYGAVVQYVTTPDAPAPFQVGDMVRIVDLPGLPPREPAGKIVKIVEYGAGYYVDRAGQISLYEPWQLVKD